ncbi:MAG: GMC family oxidoreductase [Planctomycetota bacterium]
MPVPRCDDGRRHRIILGGGLCGLMMARIWLERSNDRITVIEAGEETDPNRRPAEWLAQLHGADDWCFQTQPVATLSGRCLDWPRGRGMGGSSRINAMIWMPPQPEDVAMMAKVGISPDRFHDAIGLATERIRPERPRVIAETTRRCLLHCPDPNMQAFSRFNQHGSRWTSMDLINQWRAAHSGSSSRLEIIRGEVHQINQIGNIVSSVDVGTSHDVRRIELDPGTIVVSTLGTIGSPGLCLRSGLESPSIGRNLHDHLVMPVIHCIDHVAMPSTPWSMTELARYQHAGTGIITSNLAEAGGITSNRQWQVHITPTHYLTYPRQVDPAMTIGVNVARPESRGRVQWIDGKIVIEPGYGSSKADLNRLRDGVRHVRRWIRILRESATSSDSAWLRHELIPGERRQSDSQLDASIRRYAQTLYHPGGTCAMGDVVNETYRVKGLRNFFIADASVLPGPTMANPSAMLAAIAVDAAIVIGEQVSR